MTSRLQSIALVVVLATTCFGCARARSWWSPDEGYVASGADAAPYDQARSACLAQAEFRNSNGTPFTNWEEFEACMGEAGWVRAAGQ